MNKDMISFIIRTKNEERDIGFVLKSIRDQIIDLEIEIILVDSGSTDKTIEVAKPYIDRLILLDPNSFTWGKALNAGIRESKGTYICLLSGHCIITSMNAIDKSIGLLKENNISAIYGRQIGDIQKDLFECIELERDYPEIDYYEFGMNEMLAGRSIGISNACCILKRSSWINIQYNETIQSAEDVIWAKEICSQGVRLAYTSYLPVCHGHPFDIKYIYRKWYWRESISIDCASFKIKPFYNILYSMALFVRLMLDYCQKLKRKKEKICFRDIVCLSLIQAAAKYHARFDIFTDKKLKLSNYQSMKIPNMIINIGKYIRYHVDTNEKK